MDDKSSSGGGGGETEFPATSLCMMMRRGRGGIRRLAAAMPEPRTGAFTDGSPSFSLSCHRHGRPLKLL